MTLPEASRSTRTPPTARPPAPTPRRLRHRDAAQCPEFSKVGTADDRQLGAAGPDPGLLYLGEPLPATATGFPHRRRLRHPRQARRHRSTPTRRPGSSSISFQNLPQTPFTGLQHALLRLRARACSRRRPSAGPTRSTATFTPWDAALSDADLDPVLHARLRARRRRPARRPTGRSTRRFKAGVADNTAGAHAPFSLTLSRDDGDQNLAALNVTTPPGFSATLRASPTARRRRSRGWPQRRLHGPARAGRPGLPGGEPDRHRGRRRGRRHPPALRRRARSTWPAPTRARRSASWSSPRRSRAPMTSATSWSGPRPRRPGHRPGHRDLGPAAADPRRHPAADCARSRSTSTADFTLNPTNCDPFAVERRRSSATKGRWPTRRRPSRSPTAPASPSGRSSTLNLTGGVKRRGHPGAPRGRHRGRRAKPTSRSVVGDAAERRAARQRPHRHAPAPARSSPPTPARPARDRQREVATRRCSTSR